MAIKSGWDCFGERYAKPSVNITIRGLVCEGQIAGIAVGSEDSGGVDNVTVEDVRFLSGTGAVHGIAHVKMGDSRGGYVTNVRFTNLSLAEGAELVFGVLVNSHYPQPNPSCPKGWTQLHALRFQPLGLRTCTSADRRGRAGPGRDARRCE